MNKSFTFTTTSYSTIHCTSYYTIDYSTFQHIWLTSLQSVVYKSKQITDLVQLKFIPYHPWQDKKQSIICLSKFNIMHVFNSSISVSSFYFFFLIFSFLFQTRLTILISPNSFNRLHFFVWMQVFRFIICLYSGCLESYLEMLVSIGSPWCSVIGYPSPDNKEKLIFQGSRP